MARRESAHLAPLGCFLREWCSPFVPVKAKQRRSVVPAAQAMCAPQPHRQMKARVKSPELSQANSPATQPVSLEANSQVIRRVLFQANSQFQMMPPAQQRPLLELQALPRD